MLSRAVRRQDGFGLIELLISMTVLNVGILAMVAAFQSGAIALKRAGRISTAAAVANIQMERYRALRYTDIRLDDDDFLTAQADATYTGETGVYSADQFKGECGDPTPLQECQPIRTLVGPDGKKYRIDTYIGRYTPQNGREGKLVTIIVRDANTLSARAWARVASTFDESTGM